MTRPCAGLCAWAAALAAMACAPVPEDGNAARAPVARPSVPPEPAVAPSSPAGNTMLVSPAVPQALIAQMRAELATRVGVEAAAARLVSATEILWPDGGLGCAQPGERYTQSLVPGYRVEFEAGGRRYAYHASASGFFRFCPGPGDRLPKGASPGA